jgi:hypothetical protein
MKTLASQWLSGHAAAVGMLGCGVNEPGGVWLCQSADKTDCPPEMLKDILGQFEGVNNLLAASGNPSSSHTWIFARGKIRSVTRSDGWTLVIVARADAAGSRTLDVLASEFLALQPGN